MVGVLLGHFYPSVGESMKPLGDAFIKLIKMLIALIIFFTVVHGIASMKDLRRAGRVGLKALIYFEVVTTLALDRPHRCQSVEARRWNERRSQHRRHEIDRHLHGQGKRTEHHPILHGYHPSTVFGAFATGEILQVLFFAILFALVYRRSANVASPSLRLIDVVSHVFFRIVGYVMKLARSAHGDGVHDR